MNYAFILVADIHYRKDAPEGASSIMKAFLEDLGKQTKALHDHEIYIAFVGDIVRAGEDSAAFDAFAREMDDQLNALGLKKDVRIVVPGNHDLNRRDVEATFDDHKNAIEKHSGKEEAFNDFMDTSRLLTDHFSNFETFVLQFARSDESFSTRGWGTGLTEDVGVYCLNTALCSFGGLKGIDDEGQLAICTRDLVRWCKETTYPVRILLHHHPLDHLNRWSQSELQHIIERNFTICLSGHNHEPALYFNHVPNKALMCTAPPLFCGKDTTLAYSIIRIENNEPSAILYREYSGGAFFPSSRLAKTDNGTVALGNPHLRHMREMELELQHALQAFKGQPTVFVEPKVSQTRDFNEDANELLALIESPYDSIIVAPPQFGLTCLGLHMRLEAFRKHNLWLFIDAENTKARKIRDRIDEELLRYNHNATDLKCIVLDNWDIAESDHLTMVKNISVTHPNVPLVILADDTLFWASAENLAKLNRSFKQLHLQALSRHSMRQLVAGYNATKHIGTEDVVLSGLAEHLESINAHRTPLNCYTLLRVLDSNYNEKLLNKTKLMKAILFVLFTDSDSASYLSEKPEVEECAFVLGCFCKDLVKQATRSFDASAFTSRLNEICQANGIVLNVDAMLEVLFENNVLVKHGTQIEFRHRYWIFYFAAEWMRHDDEFKAFILQNRNYVNYPEIIEFYSGIDGKRTDAMDTLLADLASLIDQVDSKIGIRGSFDPLSHLLWHPTDEFIQKTRSQIAEKVGSSNLPSEIKDKHADSFYQSAAPYDQSIRKFLTEYSVLFLMHSIKASSRALRNSPFVDVQLKHKVTSMILRGWEEISKVIFWLSPILAKEGRAAHDGFALMLAEGFSSNLDERFKEIVVCNPCNVVRILGGDLASKKIGPLLFECFRVSNSRPQKHMLALFMISVRPQGWYDATLDYIDLLHPRSFFLGDLMARLTLEIAHGSLEQGEEAELKQLTTAIVSKREYASKKSSAKEIPPGKILSEENRIPIDKLVKGNRRKWPRSQPDR